MTAARASQAVLFLSVGVASYAYWAVADLDGDEIFTDVGWVLAFSGMLLLLAAALTVFGRSAGGGRRVRRLSALAGSAAAVASVANVVEDGLGQSWAVWVFVGSLAVFDLALLLTAVTVVRVHRGWRRVLAVVPAGTLAALFLFAPAGGYLMLVTWAVGAAAVLARPPLAVRAAA